MIFDIRQRPLFAALSLSLVLHLLVLFAGEGVRPVMPGDEASASQLQVVVRVDAVPATPPDANRANKASAAPATAARTVQQREPRTAVVSDPQGASVPMAPSSSTLPAPGTLSQPIAAGEAQNVSVGAHAGPASVGTVSADGLRQYRVDLASAARRFRVYPALARSRGWEGVTEVTVVVDASGMPIVRMARSSGHAVLDEQAVEMLGRAVAQTPLPESLRGRSFIVPLPIRFSLEE